MSTDFSWKRYAKNKSDSLEILQSEMDRAVADIEKQADVVDDDDIATLLGRLVESAVETKEEIETEVQKHNHETEEKLHALIKEDSQSKALFDLFGVQAETIETPSIEKPQIKELTDDMEDFLGGLAGVEEPEPEIVEEEPVIESEIAHTVAEVLAGDAEPQIMQEPIELDLIGKTSELLSQIDDIEQAPELNEIEKLTERVELIQNQLSTYKVGWGQAGMTYGSGEVRLEFLDDVDGTSVKQDGYVLTYDSATDKWIGSTGGNPVVSGSTSGDTLELVMADGSTVDIGLEHAEVYLLLEDGDKILMEDSGYLVQNQLVGNPVVSGETSGDTLTLTQHDGSTIDIDVTQIGDPFILLEDECKIILEAESGFLMGNSTIAAVVSGAVTDTTLSLTHQDDSVTDIDVTTLTNLDFEPGGYEYINDASLYAIRNDTENNGLFCPEGEWTKVPCVGYVTNNLPTGNHMGIAGSIYWEGSGSKTYTRIWETATSRFFFDELSIDTIVNFRFKMDMIPETNNTLVQARINFFAIRDGNDDPVLEDATIVEEYRITLEDDLGDLIDETDSDTFILELGTDMGQGDFPGSYNNTNYKVALETATDGGTGQLKGDHFQAYNFQQTVAAQELADGAGVEQERTFVFPVYVGDSSSQRGFGHFEVHTTSDMIVNDSSVLSGLN